MSLFNHFRSHVCASFFTLIPILVIFIGLGILLALFFGWLFLVTKVHWAFIFLPLSIVIYFCFREEYQDNFYDCKAKLK